MQCPWWGWERGGGLWPNSKVWRPWGGEGEWMGGRGRKPKSHFHETNLCSQWGASLHYHVKILLICLYNTHTHNALRFFSSSGLYSILYSPENSKSLETCWGPWAPGDCTFAANITRTWYVVLRLSPFQETAQSVGRIGEGTYQSWLCQGWHWHYQYGS